MCTKRQGFFSAFFMSANCPDGGIGIHVRLRSVCLTACEFESRFGHKASRYSREAFLIFYHFFFSGFKASFSAITENYTILSLLNRTLGYTETLLIHIPMEAPKERAMTLEEFQKKIFWIALCILTPITAVCIYIIL
jgi:hypothetical protein